MNLALPEAPPSTVSPALANRAKRERQVGALLIGLLVVCILRFWITPLSTSFWVDELVTSFVVHHGPNDPTLRVAPQVPQSIYYVLPWLTTKVLGESEIAYRLPSLLALGLALFLIYRLAARLIYPAAGWLAVFASLSLRGFNYQAADARPYALGTCVFCATVWFLIRWLDTERWRDAVLFLLFGALLWRVHLVFWPFYVVLGLYAAVRLFRLDTGVTWTRVGLVFGLLGILLVPVLLRALKLNHEAAAHVVASEATLHGLFLALKVSFVAICLVIAWLLSLLLRWPAAHRGVSGSRLVLIAGYWLIYPLCLLAFSWITGNSLFLPRYLSVALPGTALMVTLVASCFTPPQYMKPLAVVFGGGVLLALGHWTHVQPRHDISDWRGAVNRLNQLTPAANTPILCPSPFVEARPPIWRPGYPVESFLYSHLLVYRIRGEVVPLPFDDSPQAERFAAEVTRKSLVTSNRFFVFGSDRMVKFWREWLENRPELAGWHSTHLGPFGDVDLVSFEKSPGNPAIHPVWLGQRAHVALARLQLPAPPLSFR